MQDTFNFQTVFFCYLFIAINSRFLWLCSFTERLFQLIPGFVKKGKPDF